MMNRPNDWDSVKEPTEREALPVNGYVCTIKAVKVADMQRGGQQLHLMFDISEGEYAGYFERDHGNSNLQDKKYKGIFRQWLPTNDGSDKDAWTKSSLKGLISAVEKSNNGYHFNWDEQTLKGKTLGIVFREEEYDYNGHHGMAVRPFKAIEAQKVRDGKFSIPEPKMLRDSNGQTNVPEGGTGFYNVSSDEIPF